MKQLLILIALIAPTALLAQSVSADSLDRLAHYKRQDQGSEPKTPPLPETVTPPQASAPVTASAAPAPVVTTAPAAPAPTIVPGPHNTAASGQMFPDGRYHPGMYQTQGNCKILQAGCCECQESCCDNVWDDYCAERKDWCNRHNCRGCKKCNSCKSCGSSSRFRPRPECCGGRGCGMCQATAPAATGCTEPGCTEPGCTEPGCTEPGCTDAGCADAGPTAGCPCKNATPHQHHPSGGGLAPSVPSPEAPLIDPNPAADSEPAVEPAPLAPPEDPMAYRSAPVKGYRGLLPSIFRPRGTTAQRTRWSHAQ